MKNNEKKTINNDKDIFEWLDYLSTDFDLENKEILEDYNLAIYILAMIQNKLINNIITIEKGESPDYIIKQNGNNKSIGLEITHTTIQNHFKNLKEARKYPGSIVEICSGCSFLRMPGEPLSSPPFYGNQAEESWCNIISESFNKKISLLNKPHYKIQNTNILLIRNFTGYPIKFDTLFGLISDLGNNFKKKGNSRSFDEITIIWGDRLVFYNITNKCKKLSVNLERIKIAT